MDNYNPICRLEALFEEQTKLMRQFHPIESRNGHQFIPEYPIHDLSNRFSQSRLRDFAWRITEELAGETVDALENRTTTQYAGEHVQEELIDALHFLLEFSIIAGLTMNHFEEVITTKTGGLDRLERLALTVSQEPANQGHVDQAVMELHVLQVIYRLAMAVNLLKNKAWKQSHRETDPTQFHHKVLRVWIYFLKTCLYAGLAPQEIYTAYMSKHETNQTRINTGV